MLYLAHFSFSEHAVGRRGKRRTPWHGAFTCLAEARNVDAATATFEALIRKLERRKDILDGVERIYLDSCIEVSAVPKAGMLAYFSLHEGEDTGGLSTSLPGVPSRYGAAYHLAADEEIDDAEDPRPAEPFMVLRAPRTRARARRA